MVGGVRVGLNHAWLNPADNARAPVLHESRTTGHPVYGLRASVVGFQPGGFVLPGPLLVSVMACQPAGQFILIAQDPARLALTENVPHLFNGGIIQDQALTDRGGRFLFTFRGVVARFQPFSAGAVGFFPPFLINLEQWPHGLADSWRFLRARISDNAHPQPGLFRPSGVMAFGLDL